MLRQIYVGCDDSSQPVAEALEQCAGKDIWALEADNLTCNLVTWRRQLPVFTDKVNGREFLQKHPLRAVLIQPVSPAQIQMHLRGMSVESIVINPHLNGDSISLPVLR